MTHGALHVSAIAVGMAAFVSISPFSTASADSSAPSGAASATSGATSAPNGTAPTPSEATPSLSEPAPTPSVATSPNSAASPTPIAGGWPTPPQRPSHTYARHYSRHPHYAWRSGHRYRYDRNPVAAATSGVVGGMADLGSLAAYPIYCFPRYGSCPVYLPYP
jgi:hypothetical protein